MTNTVKIRGFVADKKKTMLFLYRKSHKLTYLIKLDYKSKSYNLTLGSCFYGRIYPNRSDISADGKYFIYFALGKSQKKYHKKLSYWTAISAVPSLTALYLLEHNDTWTGGGRFSGKRIYLNVDKLDNAKAKFDSYKIIYGHRLEHGGWGCGKNWTLSEEQFNPKYGTKYPIPKTWTKTNKSFSLIKTLNYRSHLKLKEGKAQGEYDLHSYELIGSEKTKYSLDAQEPCLWADFDNYDRLVLARGSMIYIYNNFDKFIKTEPIVSLDLELFVNNNKLR